MALGYDEGTVLIKIGREEPVASMDASGKIIWARHNEIQTVNVKALGAEYEDVRRPARQGGRARSCLQRDRHTFIGPAHERMRPRTGVAALLHALVRKLCL